MAQLNVFELTNAELSKSLKESAPTAKKSTAKKSVKRSKKVTESAKIGRKFRTAKKITANKLRVESLRFVEDAEENDEVIDYTPEDDVILVIDPEMDETPETVEDAVDAAEELVGDYVCKCAICGANYVCDCEDVAEDLESEEGECPVCGETGEQIVVGEIAPTEDVVEDDDNADEATDDEDGDADVDIDINVDDADDEDADFEESLAKARRRTALRRESAKRVRKAPKMRKESARKPMAKRVPSKRTRVESAKKTRTTEYNLDEVTLNRMLTKFAKENYENVRFVKITSAKCKNNRLTLEGVVVTKKGSKRSTKFVAENFKPSKAMTVNFKEIGAFTESAVSKTPAFTINFNMDRNVITPVALRYKYDVKENKATYRVEGKVMNESVKTRKPAPKRATRKSVSESRKPSRRPAKRTK